jgi:SAM-dependent methyltransferase
VWAVDVKRFADPSDPEAVRPVAEYCKTHGLGLMNGNGQTLDLLKVLKRIRYAIVHDDGRRPVADGCMDVVYSYFSGEHLRSPRGVLTETSQALRPGGICIHAIDLRDHIHRENNWLEFLYYDQWLWEAMTSRRGHWTNRLLSPQWRKLFEEQFDPAKVAAAFREYQLEMLSVDYLWVVARKPA